MKFHCLPLIAALLSAAVPLASLAQASAPAATPAAAPALSKEPDVKRDPKMLTPEQKRELAAPPDDSQPGGAALQKITIPLGKNSPGASYSPTGSLSSPKTKSSGGVNDSVARCESLVDKDERKKCLDKLGR
jgi:hypothetical protein